MEIAKGEFLGVIVAPLKVGRYVSVFENSRFNSDISIALVHRRGKVIARVPNFEESFGRDLTSTPLFESVRHADSGTYKALSIFDKVTRIFSYSVLDGLPLIVVVGSNDTHRGYELTVGREDMTMFDRMFESVEQSGQWQVLSELRNAGDVVRTTQQILRQMSAPFDLNGNIAQISSSIGITLYPEDGADAETLINNADQAMYAAKQQGRNRFNYSRHSCRKPPACG